MYYILFYHYVDEYVVKRARYRADHIKLVAEYVDRKEILLAGAYSDPANGAAIIFYTKNKKIIENFIERDPYFKHGLVVKYTIREWTVSAGCDFNKE